MRRSGDPGIVAAESVRAAADRLVGETLVSVGYVGEPTDDPPDAAVQEVGQGVLLRTGGGTDALVRWFTPGYGTGIEVVFDSEAGTAVGFTELAEVGDQPLWRRLLARPVTGIAAAWAEQGLAELPLAPWSLRLEFGPRSVVIAMGRKEAGRLVYSASSVLVFFDGADARRYVPDGDPGSAWGTPLLSALAVEVLVAALGNEADGPRLHAAARTHLPDRDPAGRRTAIAAAVGSLLTEGLVRVCESPGSGRPDPGPPAGPGRLEAILDSGSARLRVTPAGEALGNRFRDDLQPRDIT